MWRGFLRGAGGRGLPSALLLFGIPMVLGCGTRAPPWVEHGPPRAEETLQSMAVALVMSIKDQWASPHPIHAICVGTGRRVTRGLASVSGREDWDPSGFFFRRLGNPGVPAYPLSACTWGNDVEERVEATGVRAAALGASNVGWITERSAYVTVWIRESPQYARSYECEFARDELEWQALRCLYRFR